MSVSHDDIKTYLEGRNKEKYIVSIETDYFSNNVTLIYNSPTRGKYTRKHKYRPFFWFKLPNPTTLYDGNRKKLKSKMKEYGVKIKKLETGGVSRMENGFKYMAQCTGGYKDLTAFFRDGGMNPKDHRDLFYRLSPTEQYLIQTGKRLFKGYDDYNDLHRFVFDIETTGLYVNKGAKIFAIGMKDNRGFEHVLEIDNEDQEREAIITFFQIIDELKPDIISGYNSENFDVPFILKRARMLGLKTDNIAPTLSKFHPLVRSSATIKYGAEMEKYFKTEMFGYNIMDIMHSVRKAMAINSSIKRWGLKYITKYSNAAKPNRVYVEGDKIFKTWNDKVDYYFNDENGDFFSTTKSEGKSTDGFEIKSGRYIVGRYLIDDLWETEKVDMIYNQATYLLSKIVPSGFHRTATMGVAKMWSILMAGWSYENGLAIPEFQERRSFVGGLSRLLKVGYDRNIIKLDFSGLYPSEQLTHDIFPDVDISGVMKGLLSYIVNERYRFKDLKSHHKKRGEKELSDFYDKKQLPLKILANSFFGSFGAPYVFPWGDTVMAEQITCTGRQYLRHMVKYFMSYGFDPVVLDTDGVNFIMPENLDGVEYVGLGKHRFVEKGKLYTGFDAVVSRYNDEYMLGMMGLDIDEICESSINLSRKNYANLINGKVKLVGNTIKSKKMPGYIEEFLDKGVKMLLDGDGKSFVNYYYEHVENIFNMEIPLGKIASRSKVKLTNDEYTHRCKTKRNKNGKPLPRQAHMELLRKNDVTRNLGDWVYYINVGITKSQSDIKCKVYAGGDARVQFNCKLVDENDLETKGFYNVARYLDMFNKRIRALLVCFKPEVRDNLMIYHPMQREYFTDKQMELVSGIPYDEGDQDDVDELLSVSEQEIDFWKMRGLSPNYMYDNISFDPSSMYFFDKENNTVTLQEEGVEIDNLDLVRGSDLVDLLL